MSKLSRESLETKISNNALAILPVGSCEQHGLHLPFTTDIDLANMMAKAIGKRHDSVIFPPLNYGYSWVWTGDIGTVTLSQETFKKVMFELIDCIIKMGFKRIMVVNGHDSNKMALKYIARDIKDCTGIDILNIFYPNMSNIYQQYMQSPMWFGMFHADEFETSLMLVENADDVDMKKAVCEYPQKPKLYGYDASLLTNVSKSGVFGDATLATKEKGQKMLAAFMDEISSIIDEYDTTFKND